MTICLGQSKYDSSVHSRIISESHSCRKIAQEQLLEEILLQVLVWSCKALLQYQYTHYRWPLNTIIQKNFTLAGVASHQRRKEVFKSRLHRTSQLDIFAYGCDTLGTDRTQLNVLEETNKVSFRYVSEGHDDRC